MYKPYIFKKNGTPSHTLVTIQDAFKMMSQKPRLKSGELLTPHMHNETDDFCQELPTLTNKQIDQQFYFLLDHILTTKELSEAMEIPTRTIEDWKTREKDNWQKRKRTPPKWIKKAILNNFVTIFKE